MKYDVKVTGNFGFNITVDVPEFNYGAIGSILNEALEQIENEHSQNNLWFDFEWDQVTIEEDSVVNRLDDKIKEIMESDNLSYKEVKEMIADDWSKYGLRGYGIFDSSDTDVLHIEKIDELGIYETDLEAAQQAEKDGIKIIHDIKIPNGTILKCYEGTFVDTPENRELLRKELSKRDGHRIVNQKKA